MRRLVCLGCLVIGLSATRAAAQITVTAPSGGANAVASANDFATQVFQDPWDMNERSDLGWWLNSVDFPSHGFSSVNFAAASSAARSRPIPTSGCSRPTSRTFRRSGRTAARFPINADVYRIVAIRMRTPADGQYMLFYWTTNTMYDPPGLQISNAVTTTPGLAHLLRRPGDARTAERHRAVERHQAVAAARSRAGQRGGRRPDRHRLGAARRQSARPFQEHHLERCRARSTFTSTTIRTPAQRDARRRRARMSAGSSYSLNAGALAPGNYYVAIQPAGGGSFAYSTGFYQVNAPATLDVTSPSDEGSADDFATTHLNDPWDMTSAVRHRPHDQPGERRASRRSRAPRPNRARRSATSRRSSARARSATSRTRRSARSSPSRSCTRCTATSAARCTTSIRTSTASSPPRSGCPTSRAISAAGRSSASSGTSPARPTRATAGASRSTAAPAPTCSTA